MDPETGLAILAAYAGSKEVVGKILGPTADYLGEELQSWTQTRVENVGRIFKKAEERLGDSINDGGRVPPKVLKEILEDGSFADDELAVEYFGGVLASSRTGVSRDDRGAVFARVISQLSVYQLRSHYLFYRAFKAHFNGADYSITEKKSAMKAELYLSSNAYICALDLQVGENVDQILAHSMYGLSRADLIDQFQYGRGNFLKSVWPDAPGEGIIVTPSPFGIELFLWAHGLGRTVIHKFFDPEIHIESDINMDVSSNIMPTNRYSY